MPCGRASSSTRSISGCERRVFKRNGNHSQPRTGVDQLDVLGSIGEKKGKPVSAYETLLTERRSDALNARVKLPKRQVIPFGSKRRLSRSNIGRRDRVNGHRSSSTPRGKGPACRCAGRTAHYAIRACGPSAPAVAACAASSPFARVASSSSNMESRSCSKLFDGAAVGFLQNALREAFA